MNNHKSIIVKHDFVLDNLVPINFILSFLIVLHHSFTTDIKYIGTFSLTAYPPCVLIQRYLYNLSECAVPIFFFISAFLFYRTYDGSFSGYKKKMVRRFHSLFIPYLIFCTFGYIKHLVAVGGGGGILDYLHSLWICDTMPLWFIRELIALSLLAPLIFLLIRRPLLLFIISAFIVYLICIGVVPYRSFIYWIPVYCMGAAFNDSMMNKVDILLSKSIIIILSVLLLLCYLISAYFLPNGIPGYEMSWLQNFCFIFFRMVTPIVFIPFLWLLGRNKIKSRWFMKYAFFVFCMHFPVITLLGIAYDKSIWMLYPSETLKYMIIVITTYIICVSMAYFIQHYFPKVWYVLNGRRS